MRSTLFFIGYFVLSASPVLCCLPKEYETSDGQCCPMCHEGTVVHRDCTQESGTRCSACVTGTFMNKPNGLKSCFPCSSCDRGHGLFVQDECSTTRDTVCDALSGFFCKSLTVETGCGSAQRHTRCASGERTKEPGTHRNDTVCEPCQPGSFSRDGVNCTLWMICSETRVKVKDGSVSEDVVCAAASRHHRCYIPVLLLLLALSGLLIAGRLTLKQKHNISSAGD